jgi:hypothetical protein
MSALVPRERIEQTILLIRGHRVMLDADLADLYGVETKAFNRAVTRNMERFPDDFMFRLTRKEYEDLRYHFGTSRWGGRRYCLMYSLSRVLQCYPAFCEANELSKSTLPLCERLSNFEK